RPNFSAARSGRLDILESQYDEVRGLRELASFYQESERGQAELERAFEHSELVVPGSERLWRQRLRLWPPVFRAVAALRTGESGSTMGWMTRHDITKQLERLASEADDPVTHFDLAVSFLAVLSLKQAEREMNLGFESQEKLGPVPQPEILRPQTL